MCVCVCVVQLLRVLAEAATSPSAGSAAARCACKGHGDKAQRSQAVEVLTYEFVYGDVGQVVKLLGLAHMPSTELDEGLRMEVVWLGWRYCLCVLCVGVFTVCGSAQRVLLQGLANGASGSGQVAQV